MAFPFAALPFLFELALSRNSSDNMSWNRSWSRNNSWSSSSWQDESSSNPSWNNWGRQQTSTQPSVPENPVAIPQSFKPDSECYDTNTVSGKKFYRNVQTTPWSSKAGLAGKDVNSIRLVDITNKGLDDYSLRNLSNGEFQGVVFVRSLSEAVFTTNLLKLLTFTAQHHPINTESPRGSWNHSFQSFCKLLRRFLLQSHLQKTMTSWSGPSAN